MNMLQKIISEKDLAWDKHSGNTIENFSVQISDNASNELRDNHQLITNLEETFPILQQEILDFKKKFLIDGIGFFVIDGECFSGFSREETTEIYSKICKTFPIYYKESNTLYQEFFFKIQNLLLKNRKYFF